MYITVSGRTATATATTIVHYCVRVNSFTVIHSTQFSFLSEPNIGIDRVTESEKSICKFSTFCPDKQFNTPTQRRVRVLHNNEWK